MAGYTGGRIKRIRIRNFMTYDHVELHPKKGLNLIVGLNGSGKSSIMCAICLGLAGKPHFTGRASQLSDFIKHGCKEAEIELELEKARGTVLIRRKIKGEKSEWLLNHSASNHNEVSNAVKQFNIDTSNLCQFLPQEKVVEFSRMDKKQRLENMLQAIGEPHLFELFNELKNSSGEYDALNFDLKRSQAKKNSAEEENQRISDEVKIQECRVRLKKELDDLYKHRKVFYYESIRSETLQLKEKGKILERELATLKEEQKEAIATEESILNSYLQYSQKEQQYKSLKCDVQNKITKGSNDLQNLKEQVENANIEYKNRLKEVKADRERLKDINHQIEALKKYLMEETEKSEKFEEEDKKISGNLTVMQKDLNSLYKEIEIASAEKNQLDYALDRYQIQLSELQNEHNKKMENLKQRDKFSYQAACWLLQNKHTFKANIYLPIMLEIKVLSSENCKYVENTIPFRDMIAFVCENKSDYERFTDILAQKELPVNVVMPPDSPITQFTSPPLEPEYRRCGLQSYVSDLFTAPEPILRYLCSCYGIHRIPVATSLVSGDKVNSILRKYKNFFSGNFRISGKISRYGSRNMSQKKDFILEQNFLAIQNDDLQSDVQDKLKTVQEQKLLNTEKMERMELKRKELENQQEKLRQEKKSLQDIKKKLRKHHESYKQRIEYRNRISVIDVEQEKVKVTGKLRSINKQRETTLADLNKYFKEFVNWETELIKSILCMNSISRAFKLCKTTNEEVYEKVKVTELALQNMNKEYRERKLYASKLLSEIQAMDNITLLGTPEETEVKINLIQAQLNVDEDNEPLIHDYNVRKEKIEEFKVQIDRLLCKLQDMKEIVQEKKTQWLTPLQKHIENINKKFSRYFKQLDCAGEISLDIPDNPDDFVKYGLQIKLKFRDEEPLTELSQTRHSGGECSVAAIVFILSLQELTEVPFRCIDEINQGMDSVNERKIYQLIADSVGDDRCSQYFLLTPKLLPDLQYPKDVAVHIIFNSSFLNIKLDVKRHLQIAQSV